MTEIYECGTCGVVTVAPEQVCNPIDQDRNGYCGTAPERGSMCREMRQHLPYVCGSCGRPAEQGELLCNPRLTG